MALSPFSGLSEFSHAPGAVGGGGISNFNDISGCIMQCLSSQLVGYSPGDTVNNIPDTSTGGGMAMDQVHGAPKYQVVSGSPVVRFTIFDWLYTLTGAPTSITVLCKAAAGATKSRIICSPVQNVSINWLFGWWNGAMDQAFFNGALKLDGTPLADTNFHTYTATITPSLASLYLGNTLLASNNNGTKNPGSGIGCNCDPDGENSDCDFKGLVMYDNVLTGADLINAINLMASL